jgi:hypothetical protein
MTIDIANLWQYHLRKGSSDHPADGARGADLAVRARRPAALRVSRRGGLSMMFGSWRREFREFVATATV